MSRKVTQIRIRKLEMKANRNLMLPWQQTSNSFVTTSNKTNEWLNDCIKEEWIQRLDDMRMNLKFAKRRTYRDE